jgi:hypothetical protein
VAAGLPLLSLLLPLLLPLALLRACCCCGCWPSCRRRLVHLEHVDLVGQCSTREGDSERADPAPAHPGRSTPALARCTAAARPPLAALPARAPTRWFRFRMSRLSTCRTSASNACALGYSERRFCLRQQAASAALAASGTSTVLRRSVSSSGSACGEWAAGAGRRAWLAWPGLAWPGPGRAARPSPGAAQLLPLLPTSPAAGRRACTRSGAAGAAFFQRHARRLAAPLPRCCRSCAHLHPIRRHRPGHAVAEGHVGLDVEDGRAVHDVCAAQDQLVAAHLRGGAAGGREAAGEGRTVAADGGAAPEAQGARPLACRARAHLDDACDAEPDGCRPVRAARGQHAHGGPIQPRHLRQRRGAGGAPAGRACPASSTGQGSALQPAGEVAGRALP